MEAGHGSSRIMNRLSDFLWHLGWLWRHSTFNVLLLGLGLLNLVTYVAIAQSGNHVPPASLVAASYLCGVCLIGIALCRWFEPQKDPTCPRCGYIVVGLTRNQCPECGQQFEANEVYPRQVRRSARLLLTLGVAISLLPVAAIIVLAVL